MASEPIDFARLEELRARHSEGLAISIGGVAWLFGVIGRLSIDVATVSKERDGLRELINTPHVDDFLEAVRLEAAHPAATPTTPT